MPWDKVFLVGGGPSLRSFDFELLRGQVVVTINDASRYLPWATALFSADVMWMANRKEHIQSFGGERYLAIPPDQRGEFRGVQYLTRLRLLGLSEVQGSVHFGGTSGYAALNLAALKGAKQIILLGFDYSGTDRWYPDYSWSSRGRGQSEHEEWARNFNTTVMSLAANHAFVVNASPDSRIAAFPKATLDQIRSQYLPAYA